MLDEGQSVPLGTAKQQTLLAVLLLHANAIVPRERLIDELWGENPPATAVKAVQVYVSQLRKRFPSNGSAIETHANGYVLELEPEELDATRFERALAEARKRAAAGATEEASHLFEQALALWRGRALAGLSFESYASTDVERLEELRLAALVDRIDCELALGRHDLVIGELEQLVAEHPLKEQLHGQRMLALYRSGRQAEALRAYREARETLVEQFGIEPSTPLQRLEHAILLQDAALEAPNGTVRIHEPAASPPPQPTRPRRRKRPSRRALALIAGALCALAATAVAAFALTRPSPGLPGVEADHVGLVDPKTGKIVEQFEVGSNPVALSAVAGTLWVANHDGRSVTRIDEQTGERTTISVPGHPSALAADARGVWVAATLEGRLVRIEREFDRAGASVKVEAASIAVVGGSLWVTRDGTTLQRLDRSGRPSGPEIVVDAGAERVTGEGRTVWVAGQFALTPVDARTGIPGPSVQLLQRPIALATGAGAVWATIAARNVVQKVDPLSASSVAYTLVGGDPGAVAVADDWVWVANRSNRTLSRIRVADLARAGVVPIGATPTALASGARGLWVAAG